jgi:hypothetical protein
VPRSPLMMLGPVFVTPAPASTAKLWVVPRFTGASCALVTLAAISAATPRMRPTTSRGPLLGPTLYFMLKYAARLDHPKRDEGCSVRSSLSMTYRPCPGALSQAAGTLDGCLRSRS